MDNLENAYNAEKFWPEANVTSNECYGCCGSGTLLINVAHAIGENRCSIYIQDISQKSSNLLAEFEKKSRMSL